MFIKNKRNKGITLIALVVTIIVLLILAGISIQMLVGEGGILNNANKAKVESTHADVKEAMQLEYADYILEKNTKGSTQTLIEYLQGRNIIPEEPEEEGKYVINVEALVGGKLSLGNGTDGTDVYKLEEVKEESTGKINEMGKIASNTPIKIAVTNTTAGKKYKIMYYGTKESENKELGTLSDTKEAKNDDVVFRVIDGGDLMNYHEFTVKSGTTWGQFVEASEYFEIYEENYICLTSLGKELFEFKGYGWYALFKVDLAGDRTIVTIDELIDSKITYNVEGVGG